jgi:hypothetical protein
MNSLELLVALVLAAAAIVLSTFTTVWCAIRIARERRDRQLFDEYVRAPHEVEAWLVHGALRQLRRLVEEDRARN